MESGVRYGEDLQEMKQIAKETAHYIFMKSGL